MLFLLFILHSAALQKEYNVRSTTLR